MDLQALQDLQLTVQEHGFAIVPVKGNGKDIPGYIYSVGLGQKFGHPELVILGLPDDLIQELVTNIIAQLNKGAMFEDGKVYPGMFSEFAVGFLTIKDEFKSTIMDATAAFYGANQFDAMQVVWPDPQGYFPWEQEFDERFAHYQPALYPDLYAAEPTKQ